MPRSYKHISNYEKEILELKSEGLTLSENVQIGVADEYIAVVDVNHFRSDMDCFKPLMEKLKSIYGFYPKYPTADAGYGSYNNYIYCYCQEHGMEKFMKFPITHLKK